ncbi:MAG: GrpB family protein [Acidimicrobiia bacterium]|nr:GrpB family protein [Acidimicrobiia bacterium]
MRIELVPPDPAWPERFAAEAARIRAALGPLALRIDHVGSTSIPGLAAKPVVDIQISVRTVLPMAPYLAPLERLGYRYVPYPDEDGVDRYPFFGRPPERPRAFHVHVCETGGYGERRTLAFRDWLRAHPEDAVAYEALKRDLARREWDDPNDYAEAKDPFVLSVLDRALGTDAGG